MFRHSGDIGDIIYSLPTIRALGGGDLYLDVNGGQDHPVVQEYYKINGKPRLKFNTFAFNNLVDLLKAQPYIKNVYIWDQNKKVDYWLDDFRYEIIKDSNLNLAEAHLKRFGFKPEENLDPWITLPTIDRSVTSYKYIINRTTRSHGNHAWWDVNLHKILTDAVFLGNFTEHVSFEEAFNIRITHCITASLLGAAYIINDCETFIGNTSALMAIAIGLGKPFYQEVYRDARNNIFASRTNGKYF